MAFNPARIIAYPGTAFEVPAQKPQGPARQLPLDLKDDMLLKMAEETGLQERMDLVLKTHRAEIQFLRSQCRWQEILDLYHPLEEKEPELVALGCDLELRSEVAFSLGLTGRYDEAVTVYESLTERDPADFHAHVGVAFNAYRILLAAKNRERILPPAEKKTVTRKAEHHYTRAEALRPDRVTAYYRHGMLLKGIQQDFAQAIPLFEKAIDNWSAYGPELQTQRHHERRAFIKSLYTLASCLLETGQAKAALKTLETCLDEDQGKDHVKPLFKCFALGKVLFHLGRLPEARKALEEADAASDGLENDFVLELLARVHLSMGDPTLGLTVLERIPNNRRRPFVRWTEADLLVRAGKVEEAKTVLQRSADKDRRSKHRSLVRLAKISYREARFDACIKAAGEATAFHRETFGTPDCDGLLWEAAGELRIGNTGRARELADEISAFRPRYQHLHRLRDALTRAERSAS